MPSLNNLSDKQLNDLVCKITGDNKDYVNTWAAGELVEKFDIDIVFVGKNDWDSAAQTSHDWQNADSPTRAICLAVIASVYGEEVEDEQM